MIADAVLAVVLIVLCCYFGAIFWRASIVWRSRRTAERICDGPGRRREAVAAAWEYAYARMRLRAADAESFASWYGRGRVASRADATSETMIGAAFMIWSRHRKVF